MRAPPTHDQASLNLNQLTSETPRSGQKKETHFCRIVATDTVDDRMLRIQEEKIRMSVNHVQSFFAAHITADTRSLQCGHRSDGQRQTSEEVCLFSYPLSLRRETSTAEPEMTLLIFICSIERLTIAELASLFVSLPLRSGSLVSARRLTASLRGHSQMTRKELR